MITEEYIKAYQDFAKIELELTSQYNGKEYAKEWLPIIMEWLTIFRKILKNT